MRSLLIFIIFVTLMGRGIAAPTLSHANISTADGTVTSPKFDTPEVEGYLTEFVNAAPDLIKTGEINSTTFQFSTVSGTNFLDFESGVSGEPIATINYDGTTPYAWRKWMVGMEYAPSIKYCMMTPVMPHSGSFCAGYTWTDGSGSLGYMGSKTTDTGSEFSITYWSQIVGTINNVNPPQVMLSLAEITILKLIGVPDGGGRVDLSWSRNGGLDYTTVETVASLNTWFKVKCTINHSTDTVSVEIDDVVVGTGNVSTGLTVDYIYFAAGGGQMTSYDGGFIDDLTITGYNPPATLRELQIKDLGIAGSKLQALSVGMGNLAADVTSQFMWSVNMNGSISNNNAAASVKIPGTLEVVNTVEAAAFTIGGVPIGGTNYWTADGDKITNNNSGSVEVTGIEFSALTPDISIIQKGDYLNSNGSAIVFSPRSSQLAHQIGNLSSSISIDLDGGTSMSYGNTTEIASISLLNGSGNFTGSYGFKFMGTLEAQNTVEAAAFTVGGVPIGGGDVPQTVECWINADGNTKDYVLGEELVGGPHIEYDLTTTQIPYEDYTWETSLGVTTIHFVDTPEVDVDIAFTYNYKP